MGSSGTNELILLTGGTGHIGYRTLIEALAAGYRVRAAVRRESSIDEIKATKSIQPYLSTVSFVIVPDISKDGAFDEALRDVIYVIHVASPLPNPTEDVDRDIIQPAINGTLGILYSALKQPTVKKVVITSSQAATTPLSAYMGVDPGVLTTASTVPSDSLPAAKDYPNPFAAYAGSKILAYNRALEFIAKEKPHFNVIHVMPTFVIGKNELATTPAKVDAGSNHVAMVVPLGTHNPDGFPAVSVHVDDVAYIHVAALSPLVTGNPNFGANCNGVSGVTWDDSNEIVRKHFPAEVASGLLPLGGSQTSHRFQFDTRETEKALGFTFKGFEEQLVNLFSWYVEVSAKEKA